MIGKASGEFFIVCDLGRRGCFGNLWTAQTKKLAAEKAIKKAGWTVGKQDACPNCKRKES